MEKLLTPADLARKMGLAVQTIYNRRSSGGSLPRCINTGRLIRFHPRDVEEWLSQMYEDASLIGRHEEDCLPHHRGRPTKTEQIARRNRNCC